MGIKDTNKGIIKDNDISDKTGNYLKMYNQWGGGAIVSAVYSVQLIVRLVIRV